MGTLSANIVFEIVSHRLLVEVSGGVFKIFLGSHVCYLLMGDSENPASNSISSIGCFIRNIWTVLTVILPSFKKKSINENQTIVVEVLANNIKEKISGGSLAGGVVPFAFEILSELKGTNVKVSGGLVRQSVLIIERCIGDRMVLI